MAFSRRSATSRSVDRCAERRENVARTRRPQHRAGPLPHEEMPGMDEGVVIGADGGGGPADRRVLPGNAAARGLFRASFAISLTRRDRDVVLLTALLRGAEQISAEDVLDDLIA
jgi:hypothetical protein